MLILTRRVGETLMIGDNVEVTVLGVKGNQVRIGVQAPKEVPVHRREIYDRIQREKQQQQQQQQGNQSHGDGDLNQNGQQQPGHSENEETPSYKTGG